MVGPHDQISEVLETSEILLMDDNLRTMCYNNWQWISYLTEYSRLEVPFG
jgi:hypothetical protein